MPAPEETIQPLSAASQEGNTSQVARIRHVAALASGVAAGALRLESLPGFAFYIAITLITSLLLLVFTRKPGFYFMNPFTSLFVDSVLPAFPGYLLAWSLVYSLVET